MKIPAALLSMLIFSGCYLLPKDQVGMTPGITVLNNTNLRLVLVRDGVEMSGALLPGEHLSIAVVQWYDNRTTNISLIIKAYDGMKFVGAGKRDFCVSHSYSKYDMQYSNNLPHAITRLK